MQLVTSGSRVPMILSRSVLVGLVAILVLAHGCVMDPEADPAPEGVAALAGAEGVAPVASDPPGGEVRPSSEAATPVVEDFESVLDRVARMKLAGDYEAALGALEHALERRPPEPYNVRMRALLIRVKRDYLTHRCLEAFVRTTKPRYVIGDVIEGELVLRNVSSERISIPATRVVPQLGKDEPVEARSLLRRVVTYREYRPDNTVVTYKDAGNFSIGEAITLAPGEIYSVPLAVDSMEINPGGTMLRTYSFEGRFLPTVIRVGAREFEGPLDYRASTVQVFPRGAEHLGDAPLERVREAYAKESPVHMSLATAMVLESERPALLEFLQTELNRANVSERMTKAVMSCLQIVAGEDRTGDKKEWNEWLMRNRR